MDEVDIDNADDLEALEARLYAQVHHEAVPSDECVMSISHTSEETVGSNRASSKRYWSAETATKTNGNANSPKTNKSQQKYATKNVQVVAANPCKTPINEPAVNKSPSSQQPKVKSASPVVKPPKTNMKLNPFADKEKSSMKLNPFAAAVKIGSNKKTISSKEAKTTNNKGPFNQREQKLKKIKKLEQKKQKSKLAKSVSNFKKKGSEMLVDIIDLDSSNESDSSDVVVIPTPAPPTFTVDDSDDDNDEVKEELVKEPEGKKEENINLTMQEENALDSADVRMETRTVESADFVKPHGVLQPISTSRIENSSRCASPCSIMSSDDFIGQSDRCRLLTDDAGLADDEELILLTSDIKSLLEASSQQSQQQTVDDQLKNENITIDQNSIERIASNAERNQILNDNETSSREFVTPKTANCKKNDYRVSQTQFKAFDVYESESDITDGVYSKGIKKSTVIREIATSSDGSNTEDVTAVPAKTKRLRKRRASSSNKELSDAQHNDDGTTSGNENDSDDDNRNGVRRTAIPFIARGPAVERCKSRKRSRTISSCAPAVSRPNKHKKSTSSGNMSDAEFIATLNDLVHAQNDNTEVNDCDNENSDAEESAPTARDIAEKILNKAADECATSTAVDEDMAIPDDVMDDLEAVFNTIDKLDELEHVKKNIDLTVAADLADQNDHIANSRTSLEKEEQIKKSSTTYHVIYRKGDFSIDGFGWNAEMRNFYNMSWSGEYFVLRNVLQKMNPDKSLWRINAEDKYNVSNKRHSNLKCTNCCEFGHMRSKCKRPKKPSICYMCGESGHHEPRCPNTICLRCGKKTQVFTKSCKACSFQNRVLCPICKIRGHSLDHCPDKWRRYHSTTEPNSDLNNSIQYNPKKCCCICGGRGHLSDNCRSALRFSEYPVIGSVIKSHQKSYEDMPTKVNRHGIGCNILYEPNKEYFFRISQNTTENKCYGRFLKAVGMDYLVKKKEKRSSKKLQRSKSTAKQCATQIAVVADQQSDDVPNQVQEITESGDFEPAKNFNNDGKELMNIVDDIQLNTFLKKTDASSSSKGKEYDFFKSPKHLSLTHSTSAKAVAMEPNLIDSDSNYSFSDHFDIPPSATQTAEIENNQCTSTQVDNSKDNPFDTLQDFIPLADSPEPEPEPEPEPDPKPHQTCIRWGISKRFVEPLSDDDDDGNILDKAASPTIDDQPCEAKIYLTQFHIKYLVSPEGQKFLLKATKDNNIKARLQFTSVGHVLVIYGLPSNQNNFRAALELKDSELSEALHRQTYTQTIPKRTDVLVRFLRESICQLLTNLGNVNDLFKRMQALEKQHSKNGIKSAEKARKSLNMILVGQLGLKDGSMHLDKLLLILKSLLKDYDCESVASTELRNEITDHWKMIFSPYRHDGYAQMIETYNKLNAKNRISKLNLDPVLLGQKILDTSLTTEQKEKLEMAKQKLKASTSTTAVQPLALNENPIKAAPMTIVHAGKRKQMSTISQTTSADVCNDYIGLNKSQSSTLPPFINVEKRCKIESPLKQQQQQQQQHKHTDTLYRTFDSILTKIKGTEKFAQKNNSPNAEVTANDAQLPSTFWSRESLVYLDKCSRLASNNTKFLEKLQLIANKSKMGQLSYNDYLAVVKLHTTMSKIGLN